MRFVLLLALPLLLGACPEKNKEAVTDKAPAPDVSPAQTSQPPVKGQPAPASPLPGKLLGSKVPAEATGTLKEVVEGFSGYEDCLQRVDLTLPADLGQDLLGTVDIPDGLCRTREALARKKVRACDRMNAYSMRKGCRTMYAVYHESPDECRRGSPSRYGRDAYCLALSAREPRLCQAARSERQAVRCSAILAQDDQLCEDLTRHAWRKACKAEVQRWAGVMQGRSKVPAEEVSAGMTVSLGRQGSSSGPSLPVGEVSVTCANIGALVPSHGDTAHVVLCDYSSYSRRYRRSRTSGSGSASPQVQVRLSFKPPQEQDLDQVLRFGSDADFTIKLDRRTEYREGASGELRLTSFSRQRGGQVAGTFKVTVGRLRDKITVEGTFETFVRDLVEPNRMRRYNSSSRRGLGSSSRSGIRNLISGRGTGKESQGVLDLLRGSGQATAERVPSRGKRFAALYSAAKIAPRSAGSQAGLHFTAIRSDSIWSRLGLKDGDVLLSFDGIQTQSRRDLSGLRSHLRSASRVTLKLRRAGKPVTIQTSAVILNGIRQEFSL